MSRRIMLWSVVCVSGVLSCSATPAFSQSPSSDGSEKVCIYLGNYTSAGCRQRIYRPELDRMVGKLIEPVLACVSTNSTFLALHPNRRFNYAVRVTTDPRGRRAGAVVAFAIDPSTGDSERLNQQVCGGLEASDVTIDRAGKNVLVACYHTGYAAVLPIVADDRLHEMSSVVRHHGSGTKPGRQGAPHRHSINLDPADRFAFVPDLGLDQVPVYRFEPLAGTLTPNVPPAAMVAPGSGPPSSALHPDGRHADFIRPVCCGRPVRLE